MNNKIFMQQDHKNVSQEDIKKIIFSLHPIERKSLLDLESKKYDSSNQQFITGVLLLEQKQLTTHKKEEIEVIELDKFGIKALKENFPEINLLNELKETKEKKKKVSDLKIDKSLVGSAIGELKKLNLIEIKKEDELIISLKNSAEEYLKNYSNPLKIFEKEVKVSNLSKQQQEVLNKFQQRKGFLKKSLKKHYYINLTSLGTKVVFELKNRYPNLDLLETVDQEMLKEKSWRGKNFRYYDINIETSIPQIGRRHPMFEANDILKNIFIEMGFKEMLGPVVESAFWNMDIMWIPQDHPARDEQDTFYLEGVCDLPIDIVNKVKLMHENGIKNTHTQKGEWSEEIAKKQLLRTHSTSTSFRTLYELSKKQKNGENINGKYFYLANVFRNEAIDATHLAEFFQGEGFIIGDDLSLADLMGFVKVYLNKLGFEKIKFKPTFNPYTEPSMEAHIYDEDLKKWYAVINSGIFREETLRPLGIENKTIIAWGFGASRIAAKLANKTSMRDITGNSCDFEWLKNRENMQRKVKRRDK